jgi:hypothetical protein
MIHTPNYPLAFILLSLSLAFIFFCISKLGKMSKETNYSPTNRSGEKKIITETEITSFILFVRSISCQKQRFDLVQLFMRNRGKEIKKYHYGLWIYLNNPANIV